MGGAIGGLCGILGLIEPEAAGGGFNPCLIAAAGNFSVGLLLFILLPAVTTLLAFPSGAPAFSPRCWRWECWLGTAFGMAAAVLFPRITRRPVPFAMPDGGADGGVGARPADGIVLVLEMTDNRTSSFCQ